MIGLPEHDPGAPGDESGAILTPLVDVVFMLVAFLILTANSIPLSFEVDLPATQVAAPSTPVSALIQLDVPPSSGWRIDTVRFADDEAARRRLTEALAADPDGVVVIGIDRNTPAQRLIDAFDLARSAGAAQVELAAERPTMPVP